MIRQGATEFLDHKVKATEQYLEYIEYVKENNQAWAKAGFGNAPVTKMNDVIELAKANWGKIITVAAAFGVPLGVADTGAFKSILGVLSNFWPF